MNTNAVRQRILTPIYPKSRDKAHLQWLHNELAALLTRDIVDVPLWNLQDLHPESQ